MFLVCGEVQCIKRNRNKELECDETGIHIVLDKGVNAIIGENNSGKSAVIDAIRIAFSTIPYNKDIFFSKSDFHVDQKGKRAEWAQIDVYLDEVPLSLIEICNPEDELTGEFHLRFYIEITSAGMERIKYRAWGGKVEGNSLSSNTFDAINIAYLGALRNAENEMRPSRTSKLAKLLTAVITNEEEKSALVEELLRANKAILEMQPIKKTRDIINANLADMEQELLYQQVDIGLVDPKYESIASSLRSWIVPRWCFVPADFDYFDEIKRICVKIGKQDLFQEVDDGIYLDVRSFQSYEITVETGKVNESLFALENQSFELHQNGLGYNNLLFMAAVLGDMSVEKPGVHLNIFAIEEPEAHLHPQLQELIHNFFERKHRDQDSIQVIYTSHSPSLVSRIGINSLNLLYEDFLSIKCYPLVHAQIDEVDRDYLEKYLDVTKSQMFFAKGIVFVEGISEALLLPEMAKSLKRPFDKYAVEMVNVDGISFKPFANLLKVTSGVNCFAKAAVITDDDRCTDKSKKDLYIDKNLDYDEKNISDIAEKIETGLPSDRYNKIKSLCSGANITLCGAKKTLEYELALHENNIPYILEAIINEFPQVGISLKKLVERETSIERKASRIWLFVRARNKSKGQIAQALNRIIKKQNDDRHAGKEVEVPFVVPPYIEKAIYAVTESKH